MHLDVDDTLGVIYIHERNRAHTGAEGAGGGGAFDFTSHSAYSMHNQGSQAGTLSACSKGSKDGTHAGGGAAKERWGGRGGSRASEGAWVTTSSVPGLVPVSICVCLNVCMRMRTYMKVLGSRRARSSA